MNAPRTAPLAAALIGLDWGTSALRAHLLDPSGGLLETRSQPWGIRHLPPGGFAAAFAEMIGDWLARQPATPVLACGMVGSRQGWREAPYVDCPADVATLAAGLTACDPGGGSVARFLRIVPGIAFAGDRDARPERLPDVMRGEETQVFGAVAVAAELARESLVVLPGTHSKWCVVRDGRIVSFTTFMTGELFAVLRDHSLLGVPLVGVKAAEAGRPHATDDAPPAFLRGVRIARDAGDAAVTGRLFSTRALFLTGDLAATDVADHLSGLLVGEEIRAALASSPAARVALVLVGDAGLCGRYRAALAEFGLLGVRLLGDTAPAGLWTIARAAGLVDT